MRTRLSPLQAAHLFRFEGDDCLYRDHHGHRVIADVEGFGRFTVLKAEASFLTYADEVGSDMFRGTYEQSLTICATEHGEVSVAVQQGPLPEIGTGAELVSGLVQGAGWVLHAAGELEIDERKESAPEPAPDLPIPFFRSARCSGTMTIALASVTCEFIDGFTIDDAAALKARDFKVQNISDVTLLDSFFPNGAAREAAVASHLNTASWNCNILLGTTGLIVRKIYDRFHGRQRARVLIDGEFVGWWYEPREDRLTRWGIADFGIDGRWLEGKTEIRISIDPPPGTPLWSVSEIQVFAFSE